MTPSATTSYLYGPGGLPVEQITGSAVAYFHHDQLGSTRMLTDGTGSYSGASFFSYDAYGNFASESGSSLSTNLLFAGQYLDAETGLYYLCARYYDPTTAQFMSVDPALSSTLSPYAYTGGNPLNAVDPSGRASFNQLDDLANGACDTMLGGLCGRLEKLVDDHNPFGWHGAANPCSQEYQLGQVAGSAANVQLAVATGGLDPAADAGLTADASNVFIHYTTDDGLAGIQSAGRIAPGASGNIYLTQDALSQDEAFTHLFAGNPAYAGKGSSIIRFTLPEGAQVVPGTQPNEFIHLGGLRIPSDNVLYAGPNPFGDG